MEEIIEKIEQEIYSQQWSDSVIRGLKIALEIINNGTNNDNT